eukprot:Nk52_evm79s1810 gene=Nk52_evmTU79s1810
MLWTAGGAHYYRGGWRLYVSLGITTGVALAGALYLWRTYAQDDESEEQERTDIEEDSRNLNQSFNFGTQIGEQRETPSLPTHPSAPFTEYSARLGSSNGRKPKITFSIAPEKCFNHGIDGFKFGVKDLFVKLASCYDVYYIFQCTEKDETNTLKVMRSLKCVDERKILFCESEKGKAHIARHIGPVLHVDDSKLCIDMLQPHLRMLFFVEAEKHQERQQFHSNVLVVSNVADIA